MFPSPRSNQPAEFPKIKLIGIGGAGCSALDRMVLDGATNLEFAALNTDVQSLTGCVASQKLQLGQELTRGLGTGGDPELGYISAEQALPEIEEMLGESRIVFVCSGLGGGTGSGATPVVTKAARERGALTVAVVTLPFTFEGKRRAQQARESLAAIEEWADAVICFENDRMGEGVPPSAGIHHAFVAADQTISQAVRALVDVLTKPGLVHSGFDNVFAAVRNTEARSLFGYGESVSENRAHEALDFALKNPLMDKGKMLGEASCVLVHVIGGNSMTLYEVQIVMEELARYVDDHTEILFGVSVDQKWGNRLSVTLLTSISGSGQRRVLPAIVPAERLVGVVTAPVLASPAADFQLTPDEEMIEEEPEEERLPLLMEPVPAPAAAVSPAAVPVRRAPVVASAVEPVAEVTDSLPPPRPEAPAAKPKVAAREAEKAPTAKQESLPFEAATRGRFEKSEPTIIDGQDLDVPTFLRKKVKLR